MELAINHIRVASKVEFATRDAIKSGIEFTPIKFVRRDMQGKWIELFHFIGNWPVGYWM